MDATLYHPVAIGSLVLDGNIFLAPVAGYSDRAFRSVCIEGGADFTYTEMVSSEALVRGSGKTELLMQRAQNEDRYAIQLFGGDEQTMRHAAEIVAQKFNPALIDINAGCPVPKIIKSGAGSALTRNPDRLYAITKAVVAGSGAAPVSVKIRSGWDAHTLTWKEAALAAVEAGAQAITLHPRTKVQAYEGYADWEILAQLVELLKGKVPVFGSGDVFSPQAAKDMLLQTHCDGVMFARGAMGNPFVFRETKNLLLGIYEEPVSFAVRIQTGLRELRILCADKGEVSGCREMRKRFCAYSKGLEGGAKIREQIVKANTIADFESIFYAFQLVRH